jgi:ribosome-binding factor A
MADKKQRIGAIVQKDLADIIYALKPDLTNLACVNEVEMNYDNSMAKVYVSHLEKEKVPTLLNYLNEHKGQIRSQLAHQLDIYKVPELIFVKDDLYDQAHRIDAIIDSWHKKDEDK